MCKNCIHYEICIKFINNKDKLKQCELYANKALYTKLPCMLGETVYVVRKMNQEECIKAGITPEIVNAKNYTYKCVSYCDRPYKIVETEMKKSYYNHFGITVFLDYKEALQKLKKMNKDVEK